MSRRKPFEPDPVKTGVGRGSDMIKNSRFSLKINFLFAAFLFSFSSFSQEVIDEVTVTADYGKRKESDIPSSIFILDEEMIYKASNQHFEDLIQTIPNINWSGDGNRARYFQIRGVGELEQYEGAPNPSIGFLIDDIDFSGIGSIATLFDIEQIEVLKGAQGSRYGANALGGLIYMKRVEPDADQSARIQLRIGEDDELAAGLAFGGALENFNNAKYRLSLHHHQSNGFRENISLNRSDTNQRKETTIRFKANWETINNWIFNLSNMLVNVNDGYDAFSIDNSFKMLSDNPGKDSQKSIGSSFKATYTKNQYYDLEMITSVANSDMVFSYDADWGNESSWLPYTYDYFSKSKRNRRTVSQDIRYISSNTMSLTNSPEWVIGVYFIKLDDEVKTESTGEYNDPIYVYSDSLNSNFNSQYESLNASLYGNLNLDIAENSLLSVGLRAENRGVDYSDSNNLSMSPDETMFGGEISLSRWFERNINGYLSLSQSFKAGGFNLGVTPEGKRAFDKELLWNVEVGLKSLLINERLQLNAAIFYSKRRDQQVRTSSQLIANDPASFVFYTDNAAKGKSVGVESNIKWIHNEHVQMYLNRGILKARFDEYIGQSSLNGRDLAHAPRYSVNGGIDYRHPKGIFALLSISAKDEFYFDVSHNQKSQKFKLVNLRLGYEKNDWSLQLFMNNLLNEKYAVRGFFFGNEPPDFPNKLYTRKGDPRQIGIKYEMRFN